MQRPNKHGTGINRRCSHREDSTDATCPGKDQDRRP